MERELTHPELQELLGAYALDAVDDDERAVTEQHLAFCPRCRAEASELREVAAVMAHSGGPAPDGLWDRIAGALEEAPPPLQLAPRVGRPTRRWQVAAIAISAAAAAVAGVLGVRVVDDGRRIDRLQATMSRDALKAAAADALARPDSRVVVMRSTDGRLNAQAVVDRDGHGYLLRNDLPSLPVGRAYQLWVLRSGQPISAGVLGAEPGITAFTVDGGAPFTLAMTNEAARGAAAPTSDPVVVGTV